MHSKSEFRNSILFTISFAAAVALLVLLAVVATRAQNPIPPTAREAAASPAFASKLHPATRPAMRKPRVALSSRAGRPSPQDGVNYENGPVNGTTDAWTINYGYIVSDSFYTSSGGSVGSFDIYVWEFPGDVLSSLQWSITSSPNGGTTYGSGTVSGSSLTDTFISTNQYGYDIDKISATIQGTSVAGGTSWLNLFNASVPNGDPVYWDENSGVGCHSQGCPSQAYESSVGTIPSEAFDIGGNGLPPCFQSGGNMQIIHDFNSQTDGGNPSGGVITDPAGNVYGSMSGGSAGFGFVYKLASKNQSWLFDALYNFTGGSNGSSPGTPIVGPEGVLYGTAAGGIQNCSGGYCGLVYSLRPAPSACVTALCSWTESVVYQPTGNNDAYNPGNLVFDQEGNLYGTSASGGAYGQGAVFELTPSSGGWTETILYSFTGGNDGGDPTSVVAGIDGNVYGTAGGGADGYGVVFQLVRPPSGGSWTENVIYNLTCYYCSGPDVYSLIQDNLGNLYGIFASQGPPNVEAFELSPSGGSWVFSVLDSIGTFLFMEWTVSDLAADAAGNVYWAGGFLTPCRGGDCVYGGYADVVVRPPGGGFSDIYDAPGLFFPIDTLGLDAKRNVYGTTGSCGKYGQGTVWKLTQWHP
jgi:uncharacterized repeat protein (TIGR03803 family)